MARKSLNEVTYANKEGCLTYEVSDTSDSGLTVDVKVNDSPSPSLDLEDQVRFELKVVGDNKGRLKTEMDKSAKDHESRWTK